MNVMEAIRKKRAVRQYRDQAISDDQAASILDAGRRAQSSKNTQPWQFIAIRKKETLSALSQLGKYAGHLKDAAMGILLVSLPGNDFDLGQAAAYMQLAALELGIGSCLIAIYEPEKAKSLLGIPAEQQVQIAIAFGFPAEKERREKLGRGRKKLAEIAHWEKW